ncbi:para-aminobenzoate synthase, (PABA) [Zalaria obscura]|uniref:Para-aminobenzoate synthase, (PABA) n=1 Tax=Zalaria obscura TaxID=2024903 RepID=A0ACC3S7G7_9PEZI
MQLPRLLFLDAYDSFSNNIICLLHDTLGAQVTVIKIDDARFNSDAAFETLLRDFDAVVAGPGPGDPKNPDDVGLIGKLWSLPPSSLLPVLGICLGFQSLALAYGGRVERLRVPRHGFVTPITHQGRSLFRNLGSVEACQYHSLQAILDLCAGIKYDANLWTPGLSCASLEPLAWDLSELDVNGPILMAVKHTAKPFYGVQYHPESICSNVDAGRIVENWWSEASAWLLNRSVTAKSKARVVDLAAHLEGSTLSIDVTAATQPSVLPTGGEDIRCGPRREVVERKMPMHVQWRCINTTAPVDVANMAEALKGVCPEPVILESGTRAGKPVSPDTGRFSIIGCISAGLPELKYYTGNREVKSTLSGSLSSYTGTIQDVWSEMEGFMRVNCATDGSSLVPFWGGLVGFLSYEAGLETINVLPPHQTHPDAWFRFVERSVVVDHCEDKVYVQSIRQGDEPWLEQVERLVDDISGSCLPLGTALAQEGGIDTPKIEGPSCKEYCDMVQACQSHIRAGDSYELCLTDQTILQWPDHVSPTAWPLYCRLRALNPAPFAAFLRFCGGEGDLKKEGDDVVILSSSPERFLSWSRSGQCQFRPIKGTVKKGDNMTRDKAESILSSKKERAENLMIVDLIRHDLTGVVGSGNVRVEKLMTVEEYETVFQLVSVIEGQLPADGKRSGIDVLAASLPPGSMTGAPKKRSCELLRDIEGKKARGIYSGVLGYLDVGGGGDFSVVIRTAFRWADEGVWRVGAGGAITALSTPLGEWDEMVTKRDSSLKAILRPEPSPGLVLA